MTSLEYRLHEVGQVFAGPIFYNLQDAAPLLRVSDEFIRDAPGQFGGFPAFQIAPPLPFIPQNRHGDTLALAVVHWAGPPGQAEKALKPFTDVAPIVASGTGPLPYPALNSAFDGLYPKGIRAYWKGAFVRRADTSTSCRTTITAKSRSTTAKTTISWFRSSGPTIPVTSSASTRT